MFSVGLVKDNIKVILIRVAPFILINVPQVLSNLFEKIIQFKLKGQLTEFHKLSFV